MEQTQGIGKRWTRVVAQGLLVAGLALGLLSVPGARGEGDGMSIRMNGNLLSADPENFKWSRDKTAPYGLQVVMLYGDPTKPGPYVSRAKMPSGYRLPPHRRSDERTVTILKGIYWVGVGERYDPMTMKELSAGAFYVMQPNVPRFAWARTEVIIEEVGQGPVTNPIQYLHPEDDPRLRE
jgi:hypothetical protein